jgi:replication factor C small subunit
MWVEKYRPKYLRDIVDLHHIVESLEAFLRNPNTMPHLLFAGIPGTGKTTAALCIARELFGEQWKSFTLELNASDERGINTVRDRVKDFSRYGRTGLGNAPFPLIILHHSDQMTRPAQTALRRIMETGSRTSRFILICNYSSRIIEPIQSRCAIFRFSKLDKQAMVTHLRDIAQREHLLISGEVAEKIVEYSDGDLRYAINALQTAAAYGRDEIDAKIVSKVVGEASPKQVQLMLNKAINGNFIEARKMMYDLIGQYGFSGSEIVRQMQRELMKVSYLSDYDKAELTNIIGEYDYRLTQGANDDVQLSALLAQFSRFSRSNGEK